MSAPSNKKLDGSGTALGPDLKNAPARRSNVNCAVWNGSREAPFIPVACKRKLNGIIEAPRKREAVAHEKVDWKWRVREHGSARSKGLILELRRSGVLSVRQLEPRHDGLKCRDEVRLRQYAEAKGMEPDRGSGRPIGREVGYVVDQHSQ
jgi:hypothetical protein